MKWKLKTIAILGALAVTMGAFGAHGLKDLLSPERLEAFKTGVNYHFIHTITLLGLYIWYQHQPNQVIKHSMNLFVIGIALFSGSLYILSTQSLMGLEMKWLGPITPIGGVFFILGWLNLLLVSTDKPTQHI